MLNTTINGYTIQTLLGKGGMAEVYYAENRLHKRAAIKVLRSELESNDDIRQRFVREAETIAFLEHPNIRQVFDMGYAEGRSFIIMEYLEGMDLKQYIKKHGAVPEPKAVAWVCEILKGLHYAHTHGVVHRDIKPGNIFLTADGKVKLMDFGIAKVKSEGLGLTGTNTRMGTPIFMSPEQIRTPKAVDHRTDIYSMGVTLWTLLNGAPPYNEQTESEYELMDSIVRQPLPPLSNVSVNVSRAILLATAKDTITRLSGCGEMAEALGNNAGVVPSTLPEKSAAIDREQTLVDYSRKSEPFPKVALVGNTPKHSQVDEKIENSNSHTIASTEQAAIAKRVGAFFIDFLPCRILQLILLVIYNVVIYDDSLDYTLEDLFDMLLYVLSFEGDVYILEDLFIVSLEEQILRMIYLFTPFLYFSVFDRFFSGRSVGKLLFGLRVNRVEGSPKLTFWGSLKRQFLKLVSLVNIPGWITYFSSEEKPLLFHDMICGTVVVASKKDTVTP